MTTRAIAGVDVGGGGIRVVVESLGRTAGHELAGPPPHERGQVDPDRLTGRILSAVGVAARQLGVTAFAGVAVGLTGLPGRLDDPALLAGPLRRGLDTLSVIVAADALTAHVGALGLRPGAVVAAGTGVIALGTDLAAVWNRADGWGVLLGDDGGGAWIGMAGLKAALRAHDGRPDGSRALLGRMVHAFGDPPDVVRQVYAQTAAAPMLASFVPSVAAAAHEGDPIAMAIWHDAGVHLGRTVAAAATWLDPLLSWGGRLFDVGDLLLQPFQAEVRRRVPDARLTPPRGSSVDGALLLARSHADRPLDPRAPYLYVFDG